MDATPTSTGPLGADAAPRSCPGGASADLAEAAETLHGRWEAVHAAAAVIARLAAITPAPPRPDAAGFAHALAAAAGWRCALAGQALDDLAAILHAGLSALLAVRARGADPAPAALALWEEFARARESLLALVPPAAPGEHPPG